MCCFSTLVVLSFDIISYQKALSDLPSRFHDRIIYVEYDAAKLTLSELRRLVLKYLNCDLHEVYSVHFSPCCKSYSSADGGWSDYRLPDGAPNPDARAHDGSPLPSRYEYACLWDEIVRTVLHTLDEFVGINPDAIVTVENPTAMFRLHPSVVELIKRPNSAWRFLEVDYCKVAHPQFDGDKIFTKKPTDVITHGVHDAQHFNLPKCNLDCRFRFPSYTGRSKYHLRSIRIDRKSPIGQTKQLGTLRHAIPCTLFHLLYTEHDRWLCNRVTASSLLVLSTPVSEQDVLVNLNLRSRRIVAPHPVDGHLDVPTPLAQTDASKPLVASPPTDGNLDVPAPTAEATISSEQCATPSTEDVAPSNSESADASASSRKRPVVEHSRRQISDDLTRGQKLYLLLHFRFGHASFKRLKALLPYESIITKKNHVECPICIAAKATAKPHISRLLRMLYALGLVHFDIQEPFRVADLDGCRFNLVLVDNYTDFKWLYRLRTKDELGSKLRLWIAFLGVAPERLRHDGAGENLGASGMNSVVQICYERCIYPERTVPYQPEQLTGVERVNRTFLECVRCLLLTTPGATLELHGYAFLHACYLDQFLGKSASSCP